MINKRILQEFEIAFPGMKGEMEKYATKNTHRAQIVKATFEGFRRGRSREIQELAHYAYGRQLT